MAWVEPITLEGQYVRLEPLAEHHAADLFEAGRDPRIWAFLARYEFSSIDDARAWVTTSLSGLADGSQFPFAVINKATGKAVGSTRYMEIVPADRRLEIGWTWYAPDQWRTPLNTECKYLLLGHAFESLNALRVQLKTDLRNERSQRAIERLGAVREGVLRNHMILPLKDNYVRSTVMYSITDVEWPAVKAGLEAKQQRTYASD